MQNFSPADRDALEELMGVNYEDFQNPYSKAPKEDKPQDPSWWQQDPNRPPNPYGGTRGLDMELFSRLRESSMDMPLLETIRTPSRELRERNTERRNERSTQRAQSDPNNQPITADMVERPEPMAQMASAEPEFNPEKEMKRQEKKQNRAEQFQAREAKDEIMSYATGLPPEQAEKEVPKRDYDAEIAEARERARRSRMTTGILASLSQGIQTATGAQSPTGVFSAADAGADREVDQLLEDRERGLKEAAQDPTSAESQRMREAVKKITGVELPENVTLAEYNLYGSDLVKLRQVAAEKEMDRAHQMEMTQIRDQQAALLEQGKIDQERAKRTVPGVGTFRSEKLMEDFVAQSTRTRNAESAISRLLEIGSDPTARLSPSTVAEAQTLTNRLKGMTAEDLFGVKTLSRDSIRLANEVFQNPARLTNWNDADLQALETVRNELRTGLRNMAEGALESRDQVGAPGDRVVQDGNIFERQPNGEYKFVGRMGQS